MGAGKLRGETRRSPACTCCSACLPAALFTRRSPVRPGQSSSSSSSGAVGSTVSAAATDGLWVEAIGLLQEVLAIEKRCFSDEASTSKGVGEEDFIVDCLHDEDGVKYYLCSSSTSSVVVGYLRVPLHELYMEEVRRTLIDPEERKMRDPDCEYVIHRLARPGDPLLQEDFSYVLHAPWPFQHRELLQRRWQVSLDSSITPGGGWAIVSRSIEDDSLLPRRSDRVRAISQKAAYVLRPLSRDDGARALRLPGVELVVCQQLDLGGLVPGWAQRLCSRMAVQVSLEWGKSILQHCLRMRDFCQEVSELPPGCLHERGLPDEPCIDAPATEHREMSGREVLDAILEIERVCQRCSLKEPGGSPTTGKEGSTTSASTQSGSLRDVASEEAEAESTGEHGGAAHDDTIPLGSPRDGTKRLEAECLLDESGVKYCLCSSLESSIVTGYLDVVLDDVYPGDIWRALVVEEERLLRDPESAYQVLRRAQPDDPTLEDAVAFVWPSPWPFWDRDVLQRRWSFALPGDEGLAMVMRSFKDDDLYPESEDKVRAFVHKSGYILRPQHGFGEKGVTLTCCQQVDLGGICPEWAQGVLTRWAVSHGVDWADNLRQHCIERRAECMSKGKEVLPDTLDSVLRSHVAAGAAV